MRNRQMELAIREGRDDRLLEGSEKSLRKEGCRISVVKSRRKHISREGVEEAAERPRGLCDYSAASGQSKVGLG